MGGSRLQGTPTCANQHSPPMASPPGPVDGATATTGYRKPPWRAPLRGPRARRTTRRSSALCVGGGPLRCPGGRWLCDASGHSAGAQGREGREAPVSVPKERAGDVGRGGRSEHWSRRDDAENCAQVTSQRGGRTASETRPRSKGGAHGGRWRPRAGRSAGGGTTSRLATTGHPCQLPGGAQHRRPRPARATCSFGERENTPIQGAQTRVSTRPGPCGTVAWPPHAGREGRERDGLSGTPGCTLWFPLKAPFKVVTVMNSFLFILRGSASELGRDRGRRKESQGGSALSAQSPTRGLDPHTAEIMT